MTSYTCKVIYHTVKDSHRIKHIQLFISRLQAESWASIQQVRGFTPVAVEDNASIDAGMIHIGNVSKVHSGHYIESFPRKEK
jgi:hypothetical protein